MSEKPVVIYVSRDFRTKIKEMKRELSYEQFLVNLIEKKEGSSTQSDPGGKSP